MSAPTLRPPRDDEARAVAELIDSEWPETLPEARLRREWDSPAIERDRDVRVAADEGEIVGCAQIEDLEGAHQRFWLWLHGETIEPLLEWAERAAHERASGVARILSGAWSSNAGILAALQERDFRRVRASFRMGIELDAELGTAVFPEGVRIRTFARGDERAVYAAHMETFEDSWEHVQMSFEEWAHWTLEREDFDSTLWFLALARGEVAGIALCRPDEGDPGVAWVSILGVRRPWRRRGLGRALLLHAFLELRRRGFRRAVLGVDAESLTGAHRLYEGVGMHVLHRFEIYEKELRPA